MSSTSKSTGSSMSTKTPTKGKSNKGLYIGIFVVVAIIVVAIFVTLLLLWIFVWSKPSGTVNGQTCTIGSDCQSGNCVAAVGSNSPLYCQPSNIKNSGIQGASCSSTGAPCGSGLVCSNGTCQLPSGTKPNGSTCTMASDCTSQYCSISSGQSSGYCQPSNTPNGTTGATCTLNNAPGCNSNLSCTLGLNGNYTCQSSMVTLGQACTGNDCDDGQHCVGYPTSVQPITGYGTDEFCQLNAVTYSGLSGATCNLDALCVPGLICTGGTCQAPTITLPVTNNTLTALANAPTGQTGWITYGSGSTAACQQAQDKNAIGWTFVNNSAHDVNLSLYSAGFYPSSSSPSTMPGYCNLGSSTQKILFPGAGYSISSGSTVNWQQALVNGYNFTAYVGAQLAVSNYNSYLNFINISSGTPSAPAGYYFIPTTLNPSQNWIYMQAVDDGDQTYILVKIF